jgi:hypothetical protein
MLQRICVILGVLLAAALPACRKSETVAAAGSAGGADVEIDRAAKTVTIRSVDGTATAAAMPAASSGNFPAGFPKDIPMYPGAHVAASVDTHNGPTAATIETSDWPDDVAKFYRGKLGRWKTAMDMKTDDGHTLLLRSPDGKRSLTIAATREALKSVVTLTVTGS